ncbi:MAG: ester cyclase [Actinobacteria bacterium]|nr:MAG: ester cyclase [Actinomycetota bacterium]
MATGNKEIVRRALEDSWQDPGVFDELISSDYVGYDPALPEPIRGPQGAKDNFKQYSDAFEGAHITVKDQIAEGDAVATRWEGRGRHTGELMGIPPTGMEIVVEGLNLTRLRDGNIIEEWSNWDTLGMLQQIGAIPSATAAQTR